MSTPLIDVAVVSFASADTLRDAVAGFAADARFRVIVADNQPGDGSVETLDGLDVTVVDPGGNVGFGRGCNAAAAAGTAPFVLFLNPDARLPVDDALRLAARLEADAEVGVAAPRIEEPDGTLAPSLRRDPHPLSAWGMVLPFHRLTEASWADDVVRDPQAYTRPWAPDWMSGACLLVRRTAFERIGGFHDGYWMYCEDADLCRSLRAAGFATAFEPGATARHVGGVSAPRASLLAAHADARVTYARRWDGRAGATSVRAALAARHAVQALARRGRDTRAGHARAVRAAITPA